MTYRYQAPLTATLLLEFLDAGGWQFLTFTVTPEDERACRVYQSVTGPGLADPEHADSAAKYEMSIFEEDLDLQRRALSGLRLWPDWGGGPRWGSRVLGVACRRVDARLWLRQGLRRCGL